MELRQTMFLDAFLLVEIVKVGLRSLLAPRFGRCGCVPCPICSPTTGISG